MWTGKAELPTCLFVWEHPGAPAQPGGMKEQAEERGPETWTDYPPYRLCELGASPHCCEPQFPHLLKETSPP